MSMYPHITPEPDTIFLTVAQLAKRWHIRPSSVVRCTKKTTLPSLRPTGFVMYRLRDVEAFEESRATVGK